MSYYPHIRDMREDNDMTQSDIAKLLYISQQQYSLYEKGYRDIPTAALIKLADFTVPLRIFCLAGRTIRLPPQE